MSVNLPLPVGGEGPGRGDHLFTSSPPSPSHLNHLFTFTLLHLHPLHVTPPPVWLEECLLSVLQAQIAVA